VLQAVDQGTAAVHQDASGRKGNARAIQRGQLTPADALSAQDAVEVGQQQFDCTNIRIGREKVGNLRRRLGTSVDHAFLRARF